MMWAIKLARGGSSRRMWLVWFFRNGQRCFLEKVSAIRDRPTGGRLTLRHWRLWLWDLVDGLQVQLFPREEPILETDSRVDWVPVTRCMPEENELQDRTWFNQCNNSYDLSPKIWIRCGRLWCNATSPTGFAYLRVASMVLDGSILIHLFPRKLIVAVKLSRYSG